MKMKKQPLLNTAINNLDWNEVIEAIENMINQKKHSYIVEVNVDVILKIEQDPYLKTIADHADLVLVDGMPLMWISKWKKRPVKAKISGSDLIHSVCKMAMEKNYSIFILGGSEGVPQKAGKNIKKSYPGLRLVGTYSPPIGFERNKSELEKINIMISDAHPDILVVCFGCPKQEKWVYENYKTYGAKVSLCAGATVDFMAGRVKRAPKWMSNHGLEWFYRFLKEPRRLFKRYFIDDMRIFSLIWKYRDR